MNAYVVEPRMTQDIDLFPDRAAKLARELQEILHEKFQTAVRVRKVAGGMGYRIYQVRKEGNRHLVDVRVAGTQPQAQRITGILVTTPPELIARKVLAYHQRRGSPKSGTDWRDIALLLITFPELKSETGPVTERLQTLEVEAPVFETWREIVAQEMSTDDEEIAITGVIKWERFK